MSQGSVPVLHLPPTSTPFPYTTLFRSLRARGETQRIDGDAGKRSRHGAPVRPALDCAAAQVRDRVGPGPRRRGAGALRSEEHTSELQSQSNVVCRLLLEKKKLERRPEL